MKTKILGLWRQGKRIQEGYLIPRGRQAIRVDWIRFRATTKTLRRCRMGWEIGGGDEARVAIERSCIHAEHGKVRRERERVEKGSRVKDGES